MKFFNEKPTKKSWAINLDPKERCLEAVDSETGRHIADLLVFLEKGLIRHCSYAKSCIKNEEYDPYEHGNTFDDDGRIELTP